MFEPSNPLFAEIMKFITEKRGSIFYPVFIPESGDTSGEVKNHMKYAFLIGAIGYPALELLYRGRTHYSMALAGGCSAVFVNRIRKLPLRTMDKAILSATAITGVEYLCGCIWNRDYDVWDYRNMPLNLHGQICLPFTLLWCGLSFGMIKAFDFLDKKQGRT